MSLNDRMLEESHNLFVKSVEYHQMIQERIEYSNYHKYQGMVPEGFVLIPEEVLEKLKDFDIWKEWKHNPSILEDMSKNFLKNQ